MPDRRRPPTAALAAIVALACSRAPATPPEAEDGANSPLADLPGRAEGSAEAPVAAAQTAIPPTRAAAPLDATTPADTTVTAAEPLPPPTFSTPIVDRPITFDDLRTALTIEYRRRHEAPDAADVTIAPRMMVLHHTGGGSLDAAWRYFNRAKIEAGRETLARAGDLNVSAHFLVDRDGTIVRLLPETTFARHCVGLNAAAIGVENVGDGKRYPLTRAQIDANAALIRHLAARFPITHVIGHHESLQMQGHPYFHELEPGYRTRKGDPGPAFMAAVREQIADLGLQGPPEGTSAP